MANQIKRSEIILANGTAAVISTSEIYPGEYETMLATPDFGTEYRVLKSYDKESALSDHKWLKEQYHIRLSPVNISSSPRILQRQR